MRKIILSLGLVIGLAAMATGIIGLLTTPYPHVIPVPYRVISFGATAMMGAVVLLVITYAHGTRAGDID